jgi:hypothetical protein
MDVEAGWESSGGAMVEKSSKFQREQRRRLRGRATAIGMALGGGIGAVAGLVIGLMVHPPTAIFAVAEVGLPSAVVGAGLGFLVGMTICVVRRSQPT